jgi:hypothetical protein
MERLSSGIYPFSRPISVYKTDIEGNPRKRPKIGGSLFRFANDSLSFLKRVFYFSARNANSGFPLMHSSF